MKRVAATAGLDLQISHNPQASALRRAWIQAARAWKISEEEFTRRVAAQFKIDLADLENRDPRAIRLVPKAVAQKFGALPLAATDSSILIATSDPTNTDATKEILTNAGRQPVFRLATPYPLSRAIEEAYRSDNSSQVVLQTLVAEAAETDFQVVSSDGRGLFTSIELEAPAVMRLCDLVLHQSLKYRASEVYVEPGKDQGRIRFRIDGVLQHLIDLPSEVQNRLVARLKHLALEERTDESVIPVRDEKGEEWQAHLHSTDTPQGEMLTLRFLSPALVLNLEGLNLSASSSDSVRQILAQKGGLFLVTGPARSGKTSFIYASLGAMGGSKVISLENPVEALIPGVTQVPFDPSLGLSFAETLQQLLNQDPDVVHAGEIRDLDTARTSLRAALIGRKVLATVHSTDVVGGVRRLLEMGLAPGRVAESLVGAVSLRLLRQLCPKCSRAFDPEKSGSTREGMLAKRLGVSPVKQPVGCDSCGSTGFRGQIPISEVLVMGTGVQAVLAKGPSDRELAWACRQEGMGSLMTSAMDRVRGGETTLEEVERVLGLPPQQEEGPAGLGPVLVVDDELQDRLVIGAVLKSSGFEVVEAEDGPTGLTMLETAKRPFSLMILDLRLPGMSGKEVLTKVRRSLSTHALPVIVLTGSTNPQDEIDLLDQGADDYVQKPVVNSRLQARVRAVLRRSGVNFIGEG